MIKTTMILIQMIYWIIKFLQSRISDIFVYLSMLAEIYGKRKLFLITNNQLILAFNLPKNQHWKNNLTGLIKEIINCFASVQMGKIKHLSKWPFSKTSGLNFCFFVAIYWESTCIYVCVLLCSSICICVHVEVLRKCDRNRCTL